MVLRKRDAWESVRRQCQDHARRYVTDAGLQAANQTRAAGRYPTEAVIREAQVRAMTELVAGSMAKVAELGARVERLEGLGTWARVKAWWRARVRRDP